MQSCRRPLRANQLPFLIDFAVLEASLPCYSMSRGNIHLFGFLFLLRQDLVRGQNLTVDDTNVSIEYSAGWGSVSPLLIQPGGFFNNTFSVTNLSGSTASVSFEGEYTPP